MEFTAHNISFGDEFTIPGKTLLSDSGVCRAAIRTLNNYFDESERSKIKIADLGCLEGGYSVEFARNGYDVLGVEVRDINFQKCQYILNKVNLPNLKFVKDDVRNINKYGRFDVIYCCGLLYHLDMPVSFLNTLGKLTSKMLILNTHYSRMHDFRYDLTPRKLMLKNRILRKPLNILYPDSHSIEINDRMNFHLSVLTQNEEKMGRWFTEFKQDENKENIEKSLLASYGNNKSFWLEKHELLQSIREAGFSTVYEQFDFLENCVKDQYISKYDRGIFVGIK